jgi:hypothetical protein
MSCTAINIYSTQLKMFNWIFYASYLVTSPIYCAYAIGFQMEGGAWTDKYAILGNKTPGTYNGAIVLMQSNIPCDANYKIRAGIYIPSTYIWQIDHSFTTPRPEVINKELSSLGTSYVVFEGNLLTDSSGRLTIGWEYWKKSSPDLKTTIEKVNQNISTVLMSKIIIYVAFPLIQNMVIIIIT